jgi:hypothetical protein
MRGMLILGAIGISTIAAWTVTLDAQAPGHRSVHVAHGEAGIEGEPRLGGGHAEHIGSIFPNELEIELYLVPGEPGPGFAPPGMPTGGAVDGGPEHLISGHLGGPASHQHAHHALLVHLAHVVQHAHVVVPVQPDQAESSQATAHSGGGSDEAGTATAQPDPTANPSSQRPPGAVGPGRLMSGWSGPGLPGPGRPARPRW